MTLTVTPTAFKAGRGTAQVIQPSYYTSSLFVEPMKEDLSSLLSAFTTAYSTEPIEPAKPFQFFKKIWHSEGWDLIHLRVLDARARETFLQTVVRLFVDNLVSSEPPLTRIGALFGLYTFYMIQEETHHSRMNRIIRLENITLTLDEYELLLKLPDVVQSSLRFYATYIISRLVTVEAFHLIPHSSLGARNPRMLPHSSPILTRDIDYGHKKKTGRPSQLTQSRRADEALSALQQFVEKLEDSDGQKPSSSLLSERPIPVGYVGLKEQLRGIVSRDAIQAAEAKTLERVWNAQRYLTNQGLPLGDRDGLQRLESASTQKDGLLGLVHINDQ